jgi:UDP-glucose 4-epimerase
VALDRAAALGFEIFVLWAPTAFVRSEVEALKRAAAGVIERHFPDAPALYARRGWRLPTSIGWVYDASRIERVLGFRCATETCRRTREGDAQIKPTIRTSVKCFRRAVILIIASL